MDGVDSEEWLNGKDRQEEGRGNVGRESGQVEGLGGGSCCADEGVVGGGEGVGGGDGNDGEHGSAGGGVGGGIAGGGDGAGGSASVGKAAGHGGVSGFGGGSGGGVGFAQGGPDAEHGVGDTGDSSHSARFIGEVPIQAAGGVGRLAGWTNKPSRAGSRSASVCIRDHPGVSCAWNCTPPAWRPPGGFRPMARLLLRFMQWVLDGHCMILDRDSPRTPVPLVPRIGQWAVIRSMLDQAVRHRPVRIIVPKYRRHGISTIIQALFYFICRTVPYRNCWTVAHKEEAAVEIFNIAKIIHAGMGGHLSKGNESARRIEIPSMHSVYQCASGTGRFSGTGSTINCLLVSEYAKFENTTEQDKRALESLENAVSQTSPETIIVIESSGQGPVGDFPDRCRAAAERRGSLFNVVFIPWVWDERLRVDEDALPDEFDPPLAGDEIVLREVYKASDSQLAWRRGVMATKYRDVPFSETPPSFGWDFPATMEQCFGQKTGRVYPDFGEENYLPEGGVDVGSLSAKAYKTRAIDWGGSENHAFCCLWLLVDPDKPPRFLVDVKRCPHTVEEFLTYSWDPRSRKPKKINDHAMDCIRYAVSSLNLQCLVIVYRELYVTNPAEAVHTKLARRIHRMSGWRHESGDPNHPDIAGYRPGPMADLFRWGGDARDDRYDWSGLGDDADGVFQEAIRQGAGVADAAQYRNCMQFSLWGIPLVPHVKPPGRGSKAGYVEDGIGMVSTLISGDTVVPLPLQDVRRANAVRAQQKLRKQRPELPTDEEFEALREERTGRRREAGQYYNRAACTGLGWDD